MLFLALIHLPISVSSIDMADQLPLPLVLFRVGRLLCALPAGIVREVLPALPATRIPGVPEAVEGLVNVRGVLLTVIDAHALLGRTGEADSGREIVAIESAGRQWGLLVSEVLDFFELPASDLASGEACPGLDARAVRGAGRWQEKLFIVLDIDALLAPLIGS